MKRWAKIGPGLHLAVGLRFPIERAPADLPGMIEYEAPAGAKSHNFYWPFSPADWQLLGGVSLLVPQEVTALSDYAELRFRRRSGFRVIFGRAGEKGPFGFTSGEYVTLRLNPEDRTPEPYKFFSPLYIRIDKGAEVTLLLLEARWVSSRITIAVQEMHVGDERIPDFLVNLPKHLQVGSNAYLLLG